MKHIFRYYIWASYRRKILDALLEKHRAVFRGRVLDIGGRDRGKFQKPKQSVEQWIFADIEEKFHPDMVLDVTDMSSIKEASIDVINALELFEHVHEPEKGLLECFRVLKPGGAMVISCPFLSAIHADPSDFQRWTEDRWRYELEHIGFTIQTIVVMGRYFTILAEYIKVGIKSLPRVFRYLFYTLFPILDMVASLDRLRAIQTHHRLGKFHGGYFILAKKK